MTKMDHCCAATLLNVRQSDCCVQLINQGVPPRGLLMVLLYDTNLLKHEHELGVPLL